jgi:hypothetical protein
MCRGESSCILPISSAAIHQFPEGSRLAIRHFTEYLTEFPDDLEVRWLLNLAHMTLGEYPDKVDPRFLVDLKKFNDATHGIGKFRDIGHVVGVNRFNVSGGAIMDDFDNDGLLDVVVTSLDATQPMGIYRNKGDGKFEECTKAAGVRLSDGHLHRARSLAALPGSTHAAAQRWRWRIYRCNQGSRIAGSSEHECSSMGRLRQRWLGRSIRVL